jgi:hypothetical protein
MGTGRQGTLRSNSIVVNLSEVSSKPLPDDKWKLEDVDGKELLFKMPDSTLVTAGSLFCPHVG